MKTERSRTLTSVKYLEKKRKKFIFTFYLSIFNGIAVIVVLFLLTWLPFLQIKTVDVQGIESVDGQGVKALVLDSLVGSYFHLVPKSNFLFYPKQEIRDKILLSYKKINTLKSEVKSFSQLIISVTERVPEVIVCDGVKQDENDDSDTNSCFFSDANAFLFEKSPHLSDGVYTKYYVTTNTEPLALGDVFIDTVRFSELQKFIKTLKSYGIISNGILIGEDNSYELYIKNRGEGTAVVYFDDRTPFSKTVSNLAIFWQNAFDKKIGIDTVPDFDYINLRFGNNVFYLIK